MSHFQVWMFSKLRISLGLTSKRGALKMFVYFSSSKTDIMVNYFYKSFQIFRNFIPLENKVKILKLFKCWWNCIVCLWSAVITLTCQMFAVLGSWGGFVGLSRQAGGWLCSSTWAKVLWLYWVQLPNDGIPAEESSYVAIWVTDGIEGE